MQKECPYKMTTCYVYVINLMHYFVHGFLAEEFLSDPKRQVLETELLMLGKYLNLEVNNAMLKFEICNVIVTHLIDEVILGEDALYFK